VTCTLTVNVGGHSTISSGTARDSYNEATPQICAAYQHTSDMTAAKKPASAQPAPRPDDPSRG